MLGLLSLGDTHAHAFTQEHLRLAKSLAIPAAVAIQNARLYEQAEILRAELEQRLADLERAQKELREVQQSKERFPIRVLICHAAAKRLCCPSAKLKPAHCKANRVFPMF